MDPIAISEALKERGYTKVAIAAELGCSDVAVHYVITGHSTSKRIASHIARILGQRPEEIWPDKYEAAA